MFPLYSPCRNCIISILFPSNPLRGLWGRKVLNEAFRWWEKQQTSKWQLPMMHSHWAKQRCSCMQQILLWSTAHLFNLLYKRERGCKFNPEHSSVCLIWTDTLVFPHRKSWKIVNAQWQAVMCFKFLVKYVMLCFVWAEWRLLFCERLSVFGNFISLHYYYPYMH